MIRKHSGIPKNLRKTDKGPIEEKPQAAVARSRARLNVPKEVRRLRVNIFVQNFIEGSRYVKNLDSFRIPWDSRDLDENDAEIAVFHRLIFKVRTEKNSCRHFDTLQGAFSEAWLETSRSAKDSSTLSPPLSPLLYCSGNIPESRRWISRSAKRT